MTGPMYSKDLSQRHTIRTRKSEYPTLSKGFKKESRDESTQRGMEDLY